MALRDGAAGNEAGATPSTGQHQEPVDPKFIVWCIENGVEVHSLEPAFVQDGWRGMVATRDIAANQVLVSVPERLLMSVHSAQQDAVLGQLLQAEQHRGLSSQQVLVAHVLHEASKGAASFWAPYIRSLPATYATLGCWPPSAAAELQAPHAREAADAAHDRWRSQWRGCWRLLQELGLPAKWTCLAAWRWAASTVLSRTMYLPTDEVGALMPLGDLLNHRPGGAPFAPQLGSGAAARASADRGGAAPPASGGGQDEVDACGDGALDAAAHAYRLYARRRCSRGEQVYLCYGRHCNLVLLECYGFLLPSNPQDRAHLPPSTLPEKLRLHGTLKEAECFLHAGGEPSWQLLLALREAAASPAEWKARGYVALEGGSVSQAGDQCCALWLQSACRSVLQQLPTSAHEDEAVLQGLRDGGCSAIDDGEALMLAVQWRLSYKRILLRCITSCEQFLSDAAMNQAAPPGFRADVEGLPRTWESRPPLQTSTTDLQGAAGT